MRYFRGIVHLSSWNGALENRVSVSCVCVRLHVCWCMCVCKCASVCVHLCAVTPCALCVCMRLSPRLPMVMLAVCVFVYVFRTVDLGYVGVRALCELTAYWRLCMCVHVPYDHAQRVCDDVWCALW